MFQHLCSLYGAMQCVRVEGVFLKMSLQSKNLSVVHIRGTISVIYFVNSLRGKSFGQRFSNDKNNSCIFLCSAACDCAYSRGSSGRVNGIWCLIFNMETCASSLKEFVCLEKWLYFMKLSEMRVYSLLSALGFISLKLDAIRFY